MPNSGNTESGTVYEIGLDGSNFTVIKEFNRIHCETPRGNLL